MNTGAIIAGIFFALLGIFLIGLSFFEGFYILIYGIPVFVIGVWLLFNKNEDRIENRKDLNKKKGKK